MTGFAPYAAYGWQLCAIDKGRKGPNYHAWNTNPIPADATSGLEGAGLLHALSGTCAIDIDNLSAANPWLAERGVDLAALLAAPDAVKITSGRPNRGKLLYRLKHPLATLQPPLSGLELRCATADGKSVQDVLPPSIHPDTLKPYAWAYGDELVGDWQNLPPIPASVLALWRSLTVKEQPSKSPDETYVSDLKHLRGLLVDKDPACLYPDWIKVGMALHHETQGAAEGLALWDGWSRQAKGKYKGEGDLRIHWLSFKSAPGKRVTTASSLRTETVAEVEDFPELPATVSAPPPDSMYVKMREQKNILRAQALEKLEARVVYVKNSEKYFDCERHRLINTESAIENLFMSWMPHSRYGKVSPVKLLKISPTKRYADALGFHPGKGALFSTPEGDFANTFKNLAPSPIPPSEEDLLRINWLFDRIKDPVFREYLRSFYGHVVQQPGIKINSAPLIWSETQGNGKSTLVRALPSLLVGTRYSSEVSHDLLTSDFNDCVLGAWHVNLTEFKANSRGERNIISGKLKAWITESVIAAHPKGSAAYSMPNHFFVTASSNDEDAASLDNEDRRWAVHEMKAPAFTVSEQEWIYGNFLLTPRAAGVLRHYFLNVDISNFVASAKAPQTASRQAMIHASVSPEQEYLQTLFEQRSDVFAKDIVFASDVGALVRHNKIAYPSNLKVGKLLCAPPFKGVAISFSAAGGTYRATVLHNYGVWVHKTGKEIMAHIRGEDIDIIN